MQGFADNFIKLIFQQEQIEPSLGQADTHAMPNIDRPSKLSILHDLNKQTDGYQA